MPAAFALVSGLVVVLMAPPEDDRPRESVESGGSDGSIELTKPDASSEADESVIPP